MRLRSAGGFNSVGDCHPPLSRVFYNPPPLEAGDSPTELKAEENSIGLMRSKEDTGARHGYCMNC